VRNSGRAQQVAGGTLLALAVVYLFGVLAGTFTG
jgi:hypothetical protein